MYAWTKVSIAILALTAGAVSANAHDPRRHHHYEDEGYGGYGLPSYVPGLGTFAGGISAGHVRGTGTYIYIAPGVLPAPKVTAPVQAPKAKVLDIAEPGNNDACSMEKGVCVIRSGQ